MSRPVTIDIDRSALLHNLARVKTIAPNSKVMAMIKANAYGHGIEVVAETLQEADAFGVACLNEARRIRLLGLNNPIVLMAGFFSESELDDIVQSQCDIVVHDRSQLLALEKAALKKPLNVWLKINTGMNRLGFLPSDVQEVFERLSKSLNVDHIRCMTHFSDADDVTNKKTKNQINLFFETVKPFDVDLSLANSAAILNYPESHADWVRPGLMLFGVSPNANRLAEDYDLKPAMRLSSKLIAVRTQKKGDEIGYASKFVCPETMPVGIVPMGYGDGYPWVVSKAPVIVNGVQCKILGRVAMDLLAVDLRPVKANVGDDVIFWGPELSVETVANAIDMIPYVLLTSMRDR